MKWKLGLIGGSGLYEIPGVDGAWESVKTPWGEAVELFIGAFAGVGVVFLPRHGRGHRVSPSHLNYRANIDALKRVGCTDVVSLSACGSLREALGPGAFVIIDQYVDRTFARERSFFGDGCVAHVSMAHPVCPRLSKLAANAARLAGAEVAEGGAYLAIEGLQFSTLQESRLYRSWGLDVIGMTNMPEAKLAREAELPYASVAMVTDFDCWREDIAPVTVQNVLETLAANALKARALATHLALAVASIERSPSPIDTCLDGAIITPPAARDPMLLAKLDVVAGRAFAAETHL